MRVDPSIAFVCISSSSFAQTISSTDDTVLKQIIIFGRHGVRSAALAATTLAAFAPLPYPDFGVPTGDLTPHGLQAETILGSYFRQYLRAEGLLTGDTSRDLANSYFRANVLYGSGPVPTGLIDPTTLPIPLTAKSSDRSAARGADGRTASVTLFCWCWLMR